MANFTGTPGDDTLTGTNAADTFDLTSGGNDTISALAGDDVFILGGSLTNADRIDGGAGTDTVVLNGNYASTLLLQSTTLVSIEKIKLTATFDYSLATTDALVAAGATLSVDGSTLGATDTLTFNGAQESDASLVVYGGMGKDRIVVGAMDDTVFGGAGDDRIDLSKGGGATRSMAATAPTPSCSPTPTPRRITWTAAMETIPSI